MIINGSQYYILHNSYTPVWNRAVQYHKFDNKTVKILDRGSSEDLYGTKFKMHRSLGDINGFLAEINDIRNNGVFEISADFDVPVFGADIDHTQDQTIIINSISPVSQSTLNGFTVEVEATLTNPTFIGSNSLPDFRSINIGYTGDSSYSISNYVTYDGTWSHADNINDYGSFSGVITFDNQSLRNLRRWLANNRTTAIDLELYGVNLPFGIRSKHLPKVYINDMIETPFSGAEYWNVSINFIETR
jgi:hypothetical protein